MQNPIGSINQSIIEVFMLQKFLDRIAGKKLAGKKPLPNDLNALYKRLQELPEPDPAKTRSYKQFQAYKFAKSSLLGLKSQALDLGLLEALYLKLLMEQIIEISGMDRLAVLTRESINKPSILNGEITVDYQLRHWSLPLIIENLGRLLMEEGGANYLSIGFGSPLNKEHPEFELTMRRLNGKSPTALLQETRKELEAAKQEIEVLKRSFEECLE